MSESIHAEGQNLIRNGEFEFGFDLWSIAGNVAIGTHEAGGNRAEFSPSTWGNIVQLVPEFGRSSRFRVSCRLGLEETPLPVSATMQVWVGERIFDVEVKPGPPTIWSMDVRLPKPNFSNNFILNIGQPISTTVWVDDIVVEELSMEPGENLIKNGDFSAGSEHWILRAVEIADLFGSMQALMYLDAYVGQKIQPPHAGMYTLRFHLVGLWSAPDRHGRIDILIDGVEREGAPTFVFDNPKDRDLIFFLNFSEQEIKAETIEIRIVKVFADESEIPGITDWRLDDISLNAVEAKA